LSKVECIHYSYKTSEELIGYLVFEVDVLLCSFSSSSITLGLLFSYFCVDYSSYWSVPSALSLIFLPSAYIVSTVPFGNSMIVMPVNLLAR
jgi:hypothetical protein